MNLVVLMGRLTKDPEVRYSKEMAVANFSLAVDRRFKREGQPEADFFQCTAFGKVGEFTEKYLQQGTKVIVTGRLQNDNYEKDGRTVYRTKVIADVIEFAESKKATGNKAEKKEEPKKDKNGFMQIPDGIEEELPFV